MPNGGGGSPRRTDPAVRTSSSEETVSVEVTSPESGATSPAAAMPGTTAKAKAAPPREDAEAKHAAAAGSESEDSSGLDDTHETGLQKCEYCWKRVSPVGLANHQKLSRECLTWQIWRSQPRDGKLSWQQCQQKAQKRKHRTEELWRAEHAPEKDVAKERKKDTSGDKKHRRREASDRGKPAKEKKHRHRSPAPERHESGREKRRPRREGAEKAKEPSAKAAPGTSAAVSTEEMQRMLLQAVTASLQPVPAPPPPAVWTPTMPSPTAMPTTTAMPAPMAPATGRAATEFAVAAG